MPTSLLKVRLNRAMAMDCAAGPANPATAVGGSLVSSASGAPGRPARFRRTSRDQIKLSVVPNRACAAFAAFEFAVLRHQGNCLDWGLKALAEAVGKRFVRDVVLHAGSTSIPFAANLLALPVTEIWA